MRPPGASTPSLRSGRRALLGLAAISALLLGGVVGGAAGAAHAQADEVEIFANPTTVAIGESTAVSATGLGGLETVAFGLDDTERGSLSSDGSTYGATAEAPVNDGSALVYFRATEPGEYTVDVTDGETPLAEVAITVSADAPASGAKLEVSSSSMAPGESVTVTATGLGELGTALFGVGDGPMGGTLDPTESAVTDGSASTTFTATLPGNYVLDVTNGETPLASVEVMVVEATPSPTAALTSTPSPSPESNGSSTVLVWVIVIIAVLLVAAVVAAVVLARRRRSGPAARRGDQTRS
jgi:hypothetical protein